MSSHSKCRSCERPLVTLFLDLGLSPLSNAFLLESQLSEAEVFYPLQVYVCDACFLVQLGEVVALEKLFNNQYAYFSSYSTSWLEHAREFAINSVKRLHLNAASRVVEIASNDGYLLQYFKELGIPVLGVEPSANTAQVSLKKGIPTRIEFFGLSLAKAMADSDERADLIVANNVVAHVPDLHDFLAGFKMLLKPTGTVVWEFPHFLKLFEQRQFDTIYAEHVSYFSLSSFEQALKKHDLVTVDVEQLSTHGGSLRVYARHAGQQYVNVDAQARLKKVREDEARARLNRLETYKTFASQVASLRDETWQFFAAARKQEKRVAGYGAPAKGNTFLNFAGIRSDSLPFTVDRSVAKQGKFLPGSRIPVFSTDYLIAQKPDYIFILAWNLEKEITHDLQIARSWGAKFVTAIPSLRIL